MLPGLEPALLEAAQADFVTSQSHITPGGQLKDASTTILAPFGISALTEADTALQEAFVRAGAVAELVAAMVRSPERQLAVHAAAALLALIDGHTDAQLALQELGGIQVPSPCPWLSR